MDSSSLLADLVTGPKRTSVLKTDSESVSLRSRVYEDDDDSLLSVRIWADTLGYYLHVYLDLHTGALLATTTGTQDGDAYERAKHELKRRGYDLP